MKALRSLLIASLLALAYNASAQESPWKFEYHGFVSTSFYLQDNLTGVGAAGLGQQVAVAQNNRYVTDKALLGADIRQSRFQFVMNGPGALGAKAKAVLEFDFFGNTAASTYESLTPRIRLGYLELNWGNTWLHVGQTNQIIFVHLAPTLGHLAFPTIFANGQAGWRTPGLTLYHKLAFDGTNVELAGSIAKDNWNGVYANEIAGSPIFQGRVKADGKAGDLKWMGYVAGSYQSIDATGPGRNANGNGIGAYQPDLPNNNLAKLQGILGEVGGSITFMPVMFQFNAYSGKNIANLISTTAFQLQGIGTASGATGQVREKGFWIALSGFLSKEWMVSAAYGTGRPDTDEAKRNLSAAPVFPRLQSQMASALVKYTEGALSMGPELIYMQTTYATGATAATPQVQRYARQLMYTVNYAF